MLKALEAATAAVLLSVSLALTAGASADAPRAINIPPGDLVSALDELAKQADIELVYRRDELHGIRTQGVSGTLSTQEAVKKLLEGTALRLETDASTGAMLIALPSAQSARSDARGVDDHRTSVARADLPVQSAVLPAARPQSADAAGEEQDSQDARLGEIIVTATKRKEQRLQDVPMSIAVIGNEDIERRGLIGMEDYLRSIPGVNQIERGFDNAIIIRGINTSPQSENIGAGTTVATYFDETPITGAAGLGGGGIDVRPVDLERIEVLRGPQGTAYGSASLGGTTRLISAKPKLDGFGGKLVTSYSDTTGHGSDNSMMQGVLNIPLVTGKLALRAVGYRYDDSGYYRNVAGLDPATLAFAGQYGLTDFVRDHVRGDAGRMRSTGGRLAALWQATDNLSLSATYLSQGIEQDGRPEAGVAKFEHARTPLALSVRVRDQAGEVQDSNLDLLSLVANYDLGWGTLTSSASWVDGNAVWTSGGVSTFTFFGPFSGIVDSDFQSFTTETRVASQLSGRIQFLGGVFYENVDNGYASLSVWPGSPATNPVRTDPMADVTNSRQLHQYAAFGEVSYQLADSLTATVGGRYFKYDRDERGLQEGGLVGVPLGSGVPTHLESDEDGSTFKANLSYKPTDGTLLYASWAQGFRLGRPQVPVLRGGVCDTNNDGLIDSTNSSVDSTALIDSDSLDSYEIGGKFVLFDRRMVVDAAAYHINWDDVPVRTIVAGSSCAYTANVGAATSDGLEIQASLLVGRGVRLDFGTGYTKVELSEDAPGLPGSPKSGARLPGSPRWNANLAAQYDFQIAGRDAFVRADSFYTGALYGDFLQTLGVKAGDYIKVDARAGLMIRNLSLEFFVRNITNEDAYTWRGLAVNGAPFFGNRLRPRTVGVQVGYSFQ